LFCEYRRERAIERLDQVREEPRSRDSLMTRRTESIRLKKSATDILREDRCVQSILR